jgi:hypothetical protein
LQGSALGLQFWPMKSINASPDYKRHTNSHSNSAKRVESPARQLRPLAPRQKSAEITEAVQ